MVDNEYFNCFFSGRFKYSDVSAMRSSVCDRPRIETYVLDLSYSCLENSDSKMLVIWYFLLILERMVFAAGPIAIDDDPFFGLCEDNK